MNKELTALMLKSNLSKSATWRVCQAFHNLHQEDSLKDEEEKYEKYMNVDKEKK